MSSKSLLILAGVALLAGVQDAHAADTRKALARTVSDNLAGRWKFDAQACTFEHQRTQKSLAVSIPMALVKGRRDGKKLVLFCASGDPCIGPASSVLTRSYSVDSNSIRKARRAESAAKELTVLCRADSSS